MMILNLKLNLKYKALEGSKQRKLKFQQRKQLNKIIAETMAPILKPYV